MLDISYLAIAKKKPQPELLVPAGAGLVGLGSSRQRWQSATALLLPFRGKVNPRLQPVSDPPPIVAGGLTNDC
jgi:hypothetical protein